MRRLFALLVLLLTIALPTAAQDAPTLTLMGAPTVEDDRVTLDVRLNNVDARQLASMNVSNFTVSEPFTDLRITADPRLPVTVGVTVNLSVNSELGLLQRTLHAYFDQHYREGDEVLFQLLSGREPVIVEAATKADIDQIIDTMAVSEIYFSVGAALPEMAQRLADARSSDPDRAVFGMLVASFLNNASDVSGADSFVEAGIPLHVVQAHTFRESFTDNLRDMATRTGGIFVNNQAGALVQNTPPTAVGPLKVLYDALDTVRTVFTVSYESNALDLTVNPTVTMSVQLGANSVLTLPFSYQRQFDAPLVEFANPNITASLRPSRLPDGGTAFDLANLDIAVFVRFPDAVPRRIETLELQVTDLSRNVVAQTQLVVDPVLGGDGAYHVTWPLTDYTTPGTNTPVSISVAVTDELGLMGSAEQASSVLIAALPPLPTPTPVPPTLTPTPPPPTPTAQPTAIPTPIEVVVVTTSQATLFGQPLPINVDQLLTVFGVLVLVLLVLVLALLRRLRRIRREMREAAADAAMYADSRMDIPTPLPGEGAAPNAAAATEEDSRIVGRLIVKRGMPAGEIPVTGTQFGIGRKAGEGINLVIDMPYVSPRHCMLTFRNNRFLIRDLGSKNGTFVNGERILPERDTIVPNGSEIEITKQVVFELWDPVTVVRVDYQMNDERTERLNSRISTATADSVAFPSALGIRAAEDDDGEIGEDYSPV